MAMAAMLPLVGGLAAAVRANGPDSTFQQDLRTIAINGDRLGGFVLNSMPIGANLRLSANRAWVWQVDDTQRLELRGDVVITLGAFTFASDSAMVWINRLPTAAGDVNQIALYFLNVSDPSGRAGFGAQGKNLLVTGSSVGSISLAAVTTHQAMPAPSALSTQGQARLAAFLRNLTRTIDDGTARLYALPGVDQPQPPPDPPPVPGGPIFPPTPPKPAEPSTIEVPAPMGASNLPIVQPNGEVHFTAKETVIDEHADAVTVTGSVMIELEGEGDRGLQRLELRAERGVIFLAPGALARFRESATGLRASDVVGVYLEGGVMATDGQYTVRGSKVYYDFKSNRATIVDAVLRTYARLGRMVTLYARAAEMRQVSATQFEANKATVSTSEFFVPHLSIGAERVTLTEPPPGIEGPARIEANGIALRAGTIPFFYMPTYEGTVEPQPLKAIDMGYRSDLGAEIMTRWDLYQLFGMAALPGTDASLTVGGYTERGPAVGTKFTFASGEQSGAVDLFGLYDLGGTDHTAAGLDVEKPDDELRGIAAGQYQTALTPDLYFQSQLNYISDETFISTFRRDDFSNHREYESSAYFNSQSENTSLALLFKYGLNDFLSNSYLLASRAYQVDKLPELTYRRYGDDIWDGLLWTQTWQANLMNLRPTSGTPATLGIPAAAFGLTSQNSSIPDAFEAAGYTDDFVSRVRTRHELSLPYAENNWNIAPFLHGEGDGYLLNDFSAYSADAGDLRFLLGGGVRGSARYVRVDDAANSRFFDIHRVRHIIEPNGTLWYGYDNLEPGSLPIYDQDVEGMSGGTAAQLGVRQQWQTQRGGAGAWQSVNFLTMDTGVVLNDGADNYQPGDTGNPFRYAQSALPAFYTWRPELSQWGSNLYGAGSWQISDTLTVAGTGAYLLEDRQYVTDPDAVLQNLAKGSVGLEMRHSPDVSTYLEYRYLAPTQSELLQFGVLYQVGKKYLLAFSPQYDLRAGELRRIQGSLSRTFPDFTFNLTAGYDLIEDQTSVGVSLRIPAETAPATWSGVSTDYRGP